MLSSLQPQLYIYISGEAWTSEKKIGDGKCIIKVLLRGASESLSKQGGQTMGILDISALPTGSVNSSQVVLTAKASQAMAE